MTSRREFLQVGLAAAALPLAVRADVAPGGASPPIELYKVVYDTRFAASVAFARRAAALKLATHAIDGDVTRLWYDDLHRRWQRGPAAIAGLTAHGALFCLERLAWDQRMRVVFRGEHAASPDGCVAHRFDGSRAGLRLAAGAAGELDWPAELADAIADCRGGRAVPWSPSASFSTDAASATLFSWVIAPVVRA